MEIAGSLLGSLIGLLCSILVGAGAFAVAALVAAVFTAILASAVFLFLTATVKNKKMDNFKHVKYAHRGLHGDFCGSYSAENSLSAFRKAAELGFGIELDLRLSADGEVIVFHDDTLNRVAGREGRAEELTAEELAELSLLGTGEGVPTFKSVLECVGGRVPLLVEIKSDGKDQSVVAAAYKLLEQYEGAFILESFNPLSLAALKKLDKSIPRGFLCTKHTKNENRRSLKYRVIQRHLLNFLARPSFIAADKNEHKMLPIPIIRFLFRPAFMAWTIKSPEEEKKAYENGFDGVIFEGYIPEK